MCSTAIPVLFPCQRIGLHWYWDGGTKGTFDDYDNNIPNEINKLYVISPQRYRIIEELEHLNLPKSTQDDIVKHYDCGNKQFLFPLRLAWLLNDQSWGGQNTGNPHPRSATQTERDMNSSSGNLSSTLVHKTVKEAPLVVWYDQLVPFLGLQAETLECVILDEGEPVI